MNHTPQSPETKPNPVIQSVESYQDKLDAQIMESDGSKEAFFAAQDAVLDSIYESFKKGEVISSRGEVLTEENQVESDASGEHNSIEIYEDGLAKSKTDQQRKTSRKLEMFSNFVQQG